MSTMLGLAGTSAAAAAVARPAELSTPRIVGTRNFNVANFMSVSLSKRNPQPNGCRQSVECAGSGIRCHNSPKRLYSPPSYGAGHMSKLLLIDDEADVQYSFQRIFDSPDIELTTASSGEEGLRIIPKLKPDLVIMDVRMGGLTGLETLRRFRHLDSKLLVILMTAYGTTQTAIEAMKLGAYDYLLKPFDVPKLKEIVFNALKAASDMRQVVSYQPLLEKEDYELGIVGRSEPMQQVFKLIGQLAASDATALISGESGTGKELVARAIYHHSQRNSQTFLAINCAAIPENLLESELDRKSTRLNSSHLGISYAVFCLKKKKKKRTDTTLCIHLHISINRSTPHFRA